jgi:NAD(P)H-flavin reductase/hemoglobin-like flavoprotein
MTTARRLLPGGRRGFKMPEPFSGIGRRERQGTRLLADAPVRGPTQRVHFDTAPTVQRPAREQPQTCPAPMMNPVAVRRSLDGLKADAQTCAGDFYGYLFTGCPHLREMFPASMTLQNERLFGALLKIVALLETPDALGRYLAQLGADHRKYGVKPEHYAPVGDALLRTLRRHCPDWDDEAEAAWSAAYRLASDMMIFAAQTAPGPAAWRARVVRHERRARDLAVLTLQTDQPLPYQPGQYVTVHHPRWPRVWRQFSIANPPLMYGDCSLIELHVRAVPAGWVSSALVRDTPMDSEVSVGPAAGLMTAATLGGRDLVCVAGGTGLAPVKAIIESVLADDERALTAGAGYRRQIHLFHGARTPTDLYDMPALKDLSDTYPWLQVVPVVNDEGFPGLTGCVTDAALDYGAWMGREALISGPPEMTAEAVRQFREAGFLEGSIHYDQLETTG